MQSSTSEMSDLFLELLSEIYEDFRDLFSVDILSSSELSDKYNVFRSFRRGSESRAVSEKVSEGDRYVVNRWRKRRAPEEEKFLIPLMELDCHGIRKEIILPILQSVNNSSRNSRRRRLFKRDTIWSAVCLYRNPDDALASMNEQRLWKQSTFQQNC